MVKKKIDPDLLPKCEHCAFFQIEKNEEVGECRKNPHQAFAEDDQIGYCFPIVPPDEWCGQFQRKLSS